MQATHFIRFSVLGSLLALLVQYSSVAQVKIGSNPTTINAGSILELETINRAILLPRVSLSSTTINTMGPTGNTRIAVEGMTIYNTNAAITGSATYPANGVGNYTFDGTGWVYGDLPKGGATGQILSKTATGLSWSTPASNLLTYAVAGTSGNGIVVTATGLGVTYSVNSATQTITISVPAGVRLISVRIIETAANCGISATASILNFVIATAAADGLNTSFLNATIPSVQFYNYAAVPKQIVTRSVRFDGAASNQLSMSVTQMDSYSQYLFLLNF